MVGSCEASHHYNIQGVKQMTSNELKHEAKKQKWSMYIR